MLCGVGVRLRDNCVVLHTGPPGIAVQSMAITMTFSALGFVCLGLRALRVLGAYT